jgi:hypothetical protein
MQYKTQIIAYRLKENDVYAQKRWYSIKTNE